VEKMKNNNRKSRLVLLSAMICIVLFLVIQSASAVTYQYGDVFAAVSNGEVKHYDSDGNLKATYDPCVTGYTTGMAFDSAGNLYVTCFSNNKVVKVQRDTGTVIQTITTDPGGHVESIVFDALGNFYVGQPDGTKDILKFDSAGNFLTRYNAATERRGTDWIDLAGDQCTMFYTSEGGSIKRYDVCTDTQLTDFASGLGSVAYALRILPDGDVLVANTENILRLNSSGTIVQTYDAPGQNCWFSLNLDPDGTSFWSGDFCTGKIFKFDIATGNKLKEINTGVGSRKLWGVTVFGEKTIAQVITLEPDTDTNYVGEQHTVVATVKSNGNPVEGVDVEFEVISGPNVGTKGTNITNANGKATFTYTGSGGEGIDIIVARFESDGQTYESNQVKKIWTTPPIELCPDEYRWGSWEWDPYPTIFVGRQEVHFVNNGSCDVYNVTAMVTCTPVNIIATDPNVTIGDIPAGSGAWSRDTFELRVDMTNPQDPNKGICWRVEYDDAYGNHHVIEDVAKYCGENCSSICP